MTIDEENPNQAQRSNDTWYPPVPEGFGPWVEFNNEDPIPVESNQVVHILTFGHRRKKVYDDYWRNKPDKAECFNWFVIEYLQDCHIVAYCVKLPSDGLSDRA